jgi:16S rRNA (cytidine1402-2'-O)-methyltransferase
MNGKLFLIPNIIAEGAQQVIPLSVTEALKSIHYFLAEDVRTARRYLSSLKIYESIESLQFEVLNKDTTTLALAELMKPVIAGQNVGVISESGCPGVADPGAIAVLYAHQHAIPVVPLVGPSSILLALMSSGLNGQRFAFHGYLPIDAKEASKMIKELEKESQQKNQTQLFIETPYRNNQVLDHFLNSLKNETLLSIALDLTGSKEYVATKAIREWKKNKPNLPKEPSVFSFLAS